VTVVNETPEAWTPEKLRVGARLRDVRDGSELELSGAGLPPGAWSPGGSDAVALDLTLPGEGEWELLVDVVEARTDGIPGRGTPLVLPLSVCPRRAETWPAGRVVDLAYARFLGRHADASGRRLWVLRLAEAGSVDELAGSFRPDVGAAWPERRRSFFSALRTLMDRPETVRSAEFELSNLV
jgi:hypothetical protein